MSKYVATIYRVSARCFYRGDIQPSVAKAIRSAEIKAGRLFIIGQRDTLNTEYFGPDKTQFMEEATKRAIASMRKRKAKSQRFSLTDSARDCSLEVERVED